MSELVPVDGGRRLTAIVCQGAIAEGERCGKTYKVAGSRWSLVDQARAAGWRVGLLPDGTPDAMCPACGKPDPATAALARELDRTLRLAKVVEG